MSRNSLSFRKVSLVLVTLGIVSWLQEIFSIEWSSAHCASATDGPVSAVWGMPLPYIRWSAVSSMEYFWMPAIFILNLALLFAIAYPVTAWLLRKTDSKIARWVFGVAGTFLFGTFAMWIGLQIYTGIYKIAVANIANENYESYSDLRPVHIGFKTLRYQCTPLN